MRESDYLSSHLIASTLKLSAEKQTKQPMRGMMIFHRMYKSKTGQFPCCQYHGSLAQPFSLSCMLDCIWVLFIYFILSSQWPCMTSWLSALISIPESLERKSALLGHGFHLWAESQLLRHEEMESFSTDYSRCVPKLGEDYRTGLEKWMLKFLWGSGMCAQRNLGRHACMGDVSELVA